MNLRRVAWWLGLAGMASIVVVTLAAPLLATHDPFATEPFSQFAPPDAAHWLGTDLLGRDVFSRMLWGGRASLGGGLLAALAASVFGLMVGGGAGLAGGWWDWSLMRVVDTLLALPGLLLAIALVAVLGAGQLQAVLAVGFSLGPGFARVVRVVVLDVAQQGYVEAARAAGAKASGIFLRHILPNAAPQVLTFAVTTFSWAILNLATLDFLGLSGSPSDPTWGRMLAEGRPYLRDAPWIMLGPGAMLAATIVGLSLVGDLRGTIGRTKRPFV